MSIGTLAVACGVLMVFQPGTAPRPPQPALVPAHAPPTANGPFHVERTMDIGGEGGWDLLALDPHTHRLYVPRSSRVMVIDTETGKSVGEVANTDGVHGVALALALNRGFTSNGKAGTVTVFDLRSLKTLQTVRAGSNPDAIIFEPITRTVLCFNGRSKDVTVINAEDGTVLGAIALGGKPELAVPDDAGKVYVNLEDTSEVLRLDPKARTVEARFPLAPGEEPTGLAIDPVHKRLFSACGNEEAIVLDTETGKVLATPTIGKSPDGAEFDVTGGFALTSSGEGTLSVISTKDDKFEVVQTLPTASRARTLVIDPKTRKIYLPTAEFEAPKDGAKDAPRQRPVMKPGTFRILVVSPSSPT